MNSAVSAILLRMPSIATRRRIGSAQCAAISVRSSASVGIGSLLRPHTVASTSASATSPVSGCWPSAART